MNVATTSVRYAVDDMWFTGVLAEPAEPMTTAGVVVIHGGAGLDEHAAEQAARYASLGYRVFACDMLGDGVAGDRDRVIDSLARLRSDRAAMRARVDAAREVLVNAGATGRHAAVGFCFGGLVALEVARGGADLAAAVSVHGSLATSQPALPGELTARILACHGAADPHVPLDHVTGFVHEMTAAQARWQLNVYGGAMHGFTHRHANPPNGGVGYDAAADAASYAEVTHLLTETLRLPVSDGAETLIPDKEHL